MIGAPILERLLVGGHDRRAALDAHGAALDSRVAGERDGGHSVDSARSRKDAAVVVGKQELERAGVEQRLEP